MPERRCGTCRWHDIEGFYRKHGEIAEGMGDTGFCRRSPPMPNFIRPWYLVVRPLLEHAKQRDTTSDESDEFVFAIWPETDADDWCGEWQVKEEPPAP